MTIRIPDFSKGEDIFKLNPVLNNHVEFKSLLNEEMTFIALMCDALSPFRFSKTEEEKIKNIIEFIPSVNGGGKKNLQKRFRDYKTTYVQAVHIYRNAFNSRGDERALKGRDALINTYDQFCELYSNIDLAQGKDIEKLDKDTLDNIKQISTMVKQGTITDLARQIEEIERRLSFVVEVEGAKEFTGDVEDLVDTL